MSSCADLKIAAICINQSAHVIPIILAVWKLGLAVLPLDPNLPLMRTTQILNTCKPKFFIGNSITCKKFRSLFTNSNQEGKFLSSVVEVMVHKEEGEPKNAKTEEKKDLID